MLQSVYWTQDDDAKRDARASHGDDGGWHRGVWLFCPLINFTVMCSDETIKH